MKIMTLGYLATKTPLMPIVIVLIALLSLLTKHITVLSFLIAIALSALYATLFKRWIVGMVFYAIFFTLFLAIGSGPIPMFLSRCLQFGFEVRPEIPYGQRNAIVVLGAGLDTIPTTNLLEPRMVGYARVLEAAEIYFSYKKKGKECKIIASGGDTLHTGTSEAEAFKVILLRLGVAEKDILLESKSRNTWQNAQLSSAILQEYGADQVVLVTSGFHLRRADLFFQHFGVNATKVRSEYLTPQLSLFPIGWNFYVTDVILHEMMDLMEYSIKTANR